MTPPIASKPTGIARPFKEAMAYLNQKLPLPTRGHEDVYGAQHDHAFMVAGANRTAILEGFFNGIKAAQANGETLADFRKRFDQIVAASGWDYHGSRGWRSKLIYRENLRNAYNAGREQQMADPDFLAAHPYMEYVHSGAEHYRPQHKAWDGLILRADDPIWNTISPSNGYGCACKKFARSERYLKRTGKKLGTAPVLEYRDHVDKRTGEVLRIPKGIDPGFDVRPGSSWQRHATLKPGDANPAEVIPFGRRTTLPMPAPTSVSAGQLLPEGLTDADYARAFLAEFAGPVFIDKIGEPIAINEFLFQRADGTWKIDKDGVRHRYLRLLANAIIEPDEIWTQLEPDQTNIGQYRLKRRYLKHWTIEENGQQVPGLSAFEYVNGVWSGSTIFAPLSKRGGGRLAPRMDYMEKQRQGVLLYRRRDDQDDQGQ